VVPGIVQISKMDTGYGEGGDSYQCSVRTVGPPSTMLRFLRELCRSATFGGRGNGGERIIGNIVKDQNGTLTWVYELSFWKNPVILITVAKVLMLSLAVPVVLAFVLGLENGIAEAGTLALTVLAICGAILGVLLVVAYLMIGIIYGGKYQVLFRMDDKGVHHIQLKRQYDRAKAMGLLTALAGLAGGNLTAAGAGLLAASRQSMYTRFSEVRSIRFSPKRDTIYLNGSLSRNQVYAPIEDLPLVRDHILSRCRKDVKVR